jgi:hypothetical protein
VVPDIAEIVLLEYIVNINRDNTEHPVLHLYTNNLTPGESTPGEGSGGGPTESTETGYAAITLTGSNWTTTQTAGITKAIHDGVTFTYTASASVYGYYVTDTNNNLLWIERFSGAPFSLPGGGGDIAITPQIELN